jgi:hypothetical protein
MAAWMASSSESKTLSAFEVLVARELGFALLLCAFLSLLFSGELHRLWDDADAIVGGADTAASPYSSSTTIATLLYHLATGILLYVSGSHAHLSGTLVVGALAHMALGGAGLLVLAFAGDGKISKRTGADKRTSGFLFKNTAHVQKHS